MPTFQLKIAFPILVALPERCLGCIGENTWPSQGRCRCPTARKSRDAARNIVCPRLHMEECFVRIRMRCGHYSDGCNARQGNRGRTPSWRRAARSPRYLAAGTPSAAASPPVQPREWAWREVASGTCTISISSLGWACRRPCRYERGRHWLQAAAAAACTLRTRGKRWVGPAWVMHCELGVGRGVPRRIR